MVDTHFGHYGMGYLALDEIIDEFAWAYPLLKTVKANIRAALARISAVTDSVPAAMRRSLSVHREVALAVIEVRATNARTAMIKLCEAVADDVKTARGDNLGKVE